MIKRLFFWGLGVLGVISIPYLFKFPWTKGDYILAGSVLFTLATVYELTTKKMTNKYHRMIVGAIILGVIVLIQAWAATGPD